LRCATPTAPRIASGRNQRGPFYTPIRGPFTPPIDKTAFIEKNIPWENGCVESFNGKLRDELLNGEIFYTLKEAQVLIEAWRRHYNTIRPHSALNYRPPAPEVRSWPASPAPLPGARPATTLAPSMTLN